MTEWIQSNWGDLTVCALLLIAAALIIVRRIRKRNTAECACGCSECKRKRNC